jgi:BASS family bile acid:Na+ symporter
MTLVEIINLGVKIGIVIQVFTLGMHSQAGDLQHLAHRPHRLFRSVAAVYVVTPLVMVLLLSVLDMPGRVKLAILLLSLAPGAPLTPRQAASAGGNRAYAYSLMLWIAMAAIITVPASVEILSRLFGFQGEVTVLQVAANVAQLHFLPLLLGLALATVWPDIARRVSPTFDLINKAVLVFLGLVVLFAYGSSLRQIGLSGSVGLFIFGVASLAIGHLLGGERHDTRSVLAVINSSRAPGTAVLIATMAFSRLNVVPVIFSYLLFVQLVGLLYLRWVRSRHLETPLTSEVSVRPAGANGRDIA